MSHALTPAHADFRSSPESVGFTPAPSVPTSFAEWRRFADADFDRAADFALSWLESLDGADALTLIDALHGVVGSGREELRARFEAFVTRKWVNQ